MMTRGWLFILLLILAGETSCHKNTQRLLPGSWTYQTSTIGAVNAVRLANTNILVATNEFPPNPDSLFFYFNTYPTTSGSYTIVTTTSPAAGQVGVIFSSGNVPYHYALAPTSTGAMANVTVSGGKVSVSVPLTEFALQTSVVDSGRFIANINEVD